MVYFSLEILSKERSKLEDKEVLFWNEMDSDSFTGLRRAEIQAG